jgi:hypothetical protein
MKHHIPLMRFEYSTAEQGATAQNRVTIEIDFEKRNLALKGEGIKISTTIHSGYSVDLSDKTNDGLVFSLDGVLEDGKTINTCSVILLETGHVVQEAQCVAGMPRVIKKRGGPGMNPSRILDIKRYRVRKLTRSRVGIKAGIGYMK